MVLLPDKDRACIMFEEQNRLPEKSIIDRGSWDDAILLFIYHALLFVDGGTKGQLSCIILGKQNQKS